MNSTFTNFLSGKSSPEKFPLKKFTLLLLVFLSLYSGKVVAQTFAAPVPIVDPNTGTGGNIGQYSSLLTVNGNPAMAYYNDTRHDLMFVRANDVNGTSFAKTLTLDSLGDVGQYVSMQIVNGNPAISYYEATATGGTLKYIRANDAAGSSWGNPLSINPGGNSGQFTSLLVVDGFPAISYLDTQFGYLKYIRASDANGTTWGTAQEIDTEGSSGYFTSMKIVNGRPAISYFDALNFDLKYIRATDIDGLTWGPPQVIDASTDDVGRYSSLQVVNGAPAISYFDVTNGDLQYIRAADINGTNWNTPQVLDVTDIQGFSTSLNIVNGNPAISYYDGTNFDLKFIRATTASGTTWGAPQPVETISDVGFNSSLAIINGNPAISYWDASNGDLKYIRSSTATGSAFNPSISLDVSGDLGRFTSLQIVAGNPAVSFVDPINNYLKFARASNSAGTAWSAAITLDAAGSVGQYNSLQIVNGNPAISYYDETNGNLKYIRATNATGTTWGIPVSIDVSADVVGWFTSLKVVNGNPAIAYYDQTNHILKYVRANDASGTAWVTPITLDAGPSDVGQFCSLQVINGNPAISYHDDTNGLLKYIRATNADGTAWGLPAIVDNGPNTGSHTSLQTVNGSPAISYYNAFNGALMYVRALDANGTTWNTPLVLDGVGGAGLYTSLQIISGNPAISYYAYGDGDLRYIPATDVNGTTWGSFVTPDAPGITGQYTSMISSGTGASIAYYNQDRAIPYFVYSISVVPVTFTGIKAFPRGQDVVVEWKVENEISIRDYKIEASSDGINFKVAGTTAPSNNVGSFATYSFLDVAPGAGDHFYRVKSTSINGLIEYSSIVKVRLAKDVLPIAVFPNPVQGGIIHLKMAAFASGVYSLRILNNSGQVLFLKSFKHDENTVIETITTNNISRGNYKLQVVKSDGTSTVTSVQF